MVISKKIFHIKNIGQIQSNEIIPRQGTWQVEVVDGRNSGQQWKLEAKATDLFNKTNNRKLDGKIIYRGVNGQIYSLDDFQCIYWDIKEGSGSKTIDVVNEWTQDSGVLLKLGKNNPAGNYSGVISWSLVDGI